MATTSQRGPAPIVLVAEESRRSPAACTAAAVKVSLPACPLAAKEIPPAKAVAAVHLPVILEADTTELPPAGQLLPLVGAEDPDDSDVEELEVEEDPRRAGVDPGDSETDMGQESVRPDLPLEQSEDKTNEIAQPGTPALPVLSGEGSSDGDQVEATEREKEEYFCVSISTLGQDSRRKDQWSLDASGADHEEDCMQSMSPCMSYSGPNSNMQMVERPRNQGLYQNAHIEQSEHMEPSSQDGAVPLLSGEEPVEESHEERGMGMSPAEATAFATLKSFCTNIMKTLAPPLLKEIEGASALSAAAEPFTPRRVTRRSKAELGGSNATKIKKPSAAESVLLHALGIVPKDLSANEEDLIVLRKIFDSPLRDQHIRVMASIFGKTMPLNFEGAEGGRVEVLAH